jgi:hypothetical protein
VRRTTKNTKLIISENIGNITQITKSDTLKALGGDIGLIRKDATNSRSGIIERINKNIWRGLGLIITDERIVQNIQNIWK